MTPTRARTLRPLLRLRRLLALLVTSAACRTGTDYEPSAAPRYVGHARAGAPRLLHGDTLTVVTFNVAFGRALDSAIAVIRQTPELRDADVVLLQEMDGEGTRRVADALRISYVYYPAIRHRRTGRDFGNAVLSRWPIIADERLLLPHPSRYAGTHRIATAATLSVCGTPIRVYSTHLGTVADIRQSRRRQQLAFVLADAARFPRAVVGGDLNSGDLGDVAQARGFAWPTARGPRTTLLGRWDHLFVRGLDTLEAGTVTDNRRASDHVPVWARVRLSDRSGCGG
jgi:endonuclease/exonuclease/phosphatase family metal-dependent hydrolase